MDKEEKMARALANLNTKSRMMNGLIKMRELVDG